MQFLKPFVINLLNIRIFLISIRVYNTGKALVQQRICPIEVNSKLHKYYTLTWICISFIIP